MIEIPRKTNDIIQKEIDEFVKEREKWFSASERAFLTHHRETIEKFIARLRLDHKSIKWDDIKGIADSIHSFNAFPLAKRRALGNPNHKLKNTKSTFIFFLDHS